jgi:hypothetical protein
MAAYVTPTMKRGGAMAFVAAYEDVKSGREERPMKTPGARGWRTRFIQPPQGVVDHPVAFLVEGTKERVIRPHYHEVDQFQVIVKGGGTLGRLMRCTSRARTRRMARSTSPRKAWAS